MNASIKFGNQYGCGEALNWRILRTLFSYLRIAATSVARLATGNYAKSGGRRTLVLVNVKVVGRAENGDKGRESSFAALAVHPVAESQGN